MRRALIFDQVGVKGNRGGEKMGIVERGSKVTIDNKRAISLFCFKIVRERCNLVTIVYNGVLLFVPR